MRGVGLSQRVEVADKALAMRDHSTAKSGAVLYNLLMARRLDSLVPHFPAALLLLYSGWSGTFAVGARGDSTIVGHFALLIFVGAFGSIWPDPLRLGRGRLLLLALACSVLASHLASPVIRAGRLAIILLPALVLVPSAVARCWSSDRARRLGTRSVSLVVIAVAGWSLFGRWRPDEWRQGAPGTSSPLGHHNLEAAWLLALLPLAVVPWREVGSGRVIAGVAGALGLASLLAGRSLAAALAAGVVAVALAARSRKGRLGLAVAVPLLAAQLPRLGSILSGLDVSVAARWSYLQAAWRAMLERPALGWGPGAARWTLAEHLRPTAGVHPEDQVVADVHCLPLQIGYELGLSGLLLTLSLALVLSRHRAGEIVDPALRRAAHLGLAALAIVSCAGRPLAAAAIPLAAMIGIGAIFASEAPLARPGVPHSSPSGGTCRATAAGLAAGLAAAVIAALAMPFDLAHLAYDRAAGADSRERQMHHLRRAVELDPAFPLYRARLAWLEAGRQRATVRSRRRRATIESAHRRRATIESAHRRRATIESAHRARAAAADARAVAPLWSVAGMLAQEAGEAWSREALLRACRLNPLGAVAPYRLTLEHDSDADRVQWAARALLAEPLLLAAVAWRDREPMLRAAVDEIGRLDGVDAGWHAWLEQVLDARRASGGAVRHLALEMDGDVATSISLHAFRRRPWPVDLARIEIYESMLATVDPGATVPRATVALRGGLCGLLRKSPR